MERSEQAILTLLGSVTVQCLQRPLNGTAGVDIGGHSLLRLNIIYYCERVPGCHIGLTSITSMASACGF